MIILKASQTNSRSKNWLITPKSTTFRLPAQYCGSPYTRNAIRISFPAESTSNISSGSRSSRSCSHLAPQKAGMLPFYAFYCGIRCSHKTSRRSHPLGNTHSIWPHSCFWYSRSVASDGGWFCQASCKFCLLLGECMITDKNRVDSSETIFWSAAIMVQDIIAG